MPHIMRLIIDIGNSRAKVAAFEGGEPVELFVTDHSLKGLREFAWRTGCQNGIFSTTARMTEEGIKELESVGFPIMQLTGETRVPVEVTYHTKETLGADRIAGIVGARSLKPEGNLLVIDSGTCLTIDFLDAENHYQGGNISPGVEMRLRAMHEGTALLPLIDREGEVPKLGYDTATALRSGVIIGMTHEIEGYIRQFREKYPQLSVFLTGGDAFHIDMSEENCIFADKFLVLRGLNHILAYNI